MCIRDSYNAAHARNGNGKYLLASLNSNYLYADISKALQKTTKRIVMAFGDGDPDAKSTLEQYLRLNPDIVVEYIEGAKPVSYTHLFLLHTLLDRTFSQKQFIYGILHLILLNAQSTGRIALQMCIRDR